MNIEIPGFKTSRDFPSKNKLIIRYLNKHRLDIFKYFRIFSIYTFISFNLSQKSHHTYILLFKTNPINIH